MRFEKFEIQTPDSAESRQESAAALDRIAKGMRLALACIYLSAPAACIPNPSEKSGREAMSPAAREALADNASAGERMKKLKLRFGERIERALVAADVLAEANRLDPAYPRTPEYSGFEKLGARNKEMEKLVKTGFPKGFISGNNRRIEYTGKVVLTRDVNKDYNTETFAVASSEGRTSDRIEIYRIPTNPDTLEGRISHLKFIDYNISHEGAHNADFESDNRLNLSQRIDELSEVDEAFEASSFVKSTLPGAMTIRSINNQDPQLEHYLKIKEYWAMLLDIYFNFPKEFKETASDKEKNLIEKWVLRGEGFNPVKAQEERTRIIKSMISEAQNPRPRQSYEITGSLTRGKNALEGKKSLPKTSNKK